MAHNSDFRFRVSGFGVMVQGSGFRFCASVKFRVQGVRRCDALVQRQRETAREGFAAVRRWEGERLRSGFI